MQNTIVKEFEGNPNVVTAVFQEGGRNNETWGWVQEFWDNYYLRGQVIWDSTGQISRQLYEQPNTGLPFGRGFIIDQSGRIAPPYFGHQPQMAIAKIYELLAATGAAARPPSHEQVSNESARMYDLRGRLAASVDLDGPRSARLPSGLYAVRWIRRGTTALVIGGPGRDVARRARLLSSPSIDRH